MDITELDSVRVPFPDFEQLSENSASYTISQAGRVYREDGKLMKPQPRKRSGDVPPALVVSLSGGRFCRSLPRSVFLAFADAKLKRRAKREGLIPWHDPNAPIDPLTGYARCSVFDIYLVTRGDAQRHAMHGNNCIPTDKTPIV